MKAERNKTIDFLPEDAPELGEGARVTAYTTGIMTMSLPPIMNGIGFEIAEGGAQE